MAPLADVREGVGAVQSLKKASAPIGGPFDRLSWQNGGRQGRLVIEKPTGTLAGKQLTIGLFFRIGDEAASGEWCVLAKHLSAILPRK